MPAATIDELTIADDPARWSAFGFLVDDGVCRLGPVDVRLAGAEAGRGIVSWALRDMLQGDLDGLPTTSTEAPAREPAPAHPNGVLGLDHVVAITPALERTISALQRAGLDLRRVREEPTPAGAPRQAFFRLGGEILEVVQEPRDALERGGGSDRPAFFWGLALRTERLERTAAAFGEHAGTIRDAVQPGRRIVTIARSAGLALPIALITPPPPVREAA